MNDAQSTLLLIASNLFTPKITASRKRNQPAIWLQPDLDLGSEFVPVFLADKFPKKALNCIFANLTMVAVFRELNHFDAVLLCPIRSFNKCYPNHQFNERHAIGKDTLSKFIGTAAKEQMGIEIVRGQHLRNGGSAVTNIRPDEKLGQHLFETFIRFIQTHPTVKSNQKHNQILMKYLKLKKGEIPKPGIKYGNKEEFVDASLPKVLSHREEHLADFNGLIMKTRFQLDLVECNKAKHKLEEMKLERRKQAQGEYEGKREKEVEE